jgi:hypothetical protein
MATSPFIQAQSTSPSATAATAETGPLSRILNRHILNIAILLVLPLAMAMPLHRHIEFLRDPDIWWHLANAKALFVTHHFVSVEPYSFTVAGQRWINPEWLAEIPFWMGYRVLGFIGVYLVTWLLLGINLLLLYWRGFLKGRQSAAALWASVIGMALMTSNGGPRTIVVAYIALSAELAILEAVERGHTRLAWLLPPLFCVWINLHGSWLIGVALFVLYIACGSLGAISSGVFEQSAWMAREYKQMLSVLSLSLAALMINPYGWRLIWNPVDMMLNQKLNIAYVEEWQPLHLGWFAGKAAFAAIFLMVLANCLRGRKWKMFEFASVFFAWFAAFDHVRFTFLAAIIIVPLLAEDMARSFSSRRAVKPLSPYFCLLVLTGAIIFAVRIIPGNATLRKDQAEIFPVHSISTLQPNWRTFNALNLGGVMAFESQPNFIDPRLDTFEHHGIFKNYLDIIQIKQPLELLNSGKIDHVLFPDDTPLVYVLERSPDWGIVSREGQGADRYVLFARTSQSLK